MKLLDGYLWKATLQGLIVAWFALVMLDVFFAFVSELDNINERYTSFKALIYLSYTLPSRFYEFLPTATLIGSLLGLGNLAANSEFIAMRAAGYSIKQIIFSVLKLGLLLTVFAFFMGEWLVPASDLQARNFKATVENKHISLVSDAGLWVKQKDNVFHITKVWSKNKLTDVTIYSMKKDRSGLEKVTTAESVINTENGWQLNNVKMTHFKEQRVVTKIIKQQIDSNLLDADILEIAAMKPEQLSGSELKKIIQHQQENSLKSDKYELAYWKRFAVPISTLVMLILAMPFLFNSQRGGGAGQRVFIGIVVGIAFFLLNRVLNELGIVYGISPFISAFLPLSIFLLISLFVLRRIR